MPMALPISHVVHETPVDEVVMVLSVVVVVVVSSILDVLVVLVVLEVLLLVLLVLVMFAVGDSLVVPRGFKGEASFGFCFDWPVPIPEILFSSLVSGSCLCRGLGNPAFLSLASGNFW